jgi:hypothetical protein
MRSAYFLIAAAAICGLARYTGPKPSAVPWNTISLTLRCCGSKEQPEGCVHGYVSAKRAQRLSKAVCRVLETR